MLFLAKCIRIFTTWQAIPFKKEIFLAGRGNYSYNPSLRERVVSVDGVLFDRPACYLQINIG